ncbi:chemotaxis protein CheX [Oceanobacillus halotolerans]|uniref:chemotaxis protein CheX n=1 Tax=Oceanobacillus halotolerans TaxID=2663380 RepID=UPI0013DA6845|nr:chemotaxis protein CheX [Oceanobacillus halotolerans]
MTKTITKEKAITDLLNSTYKSLKSVVPINHEIAKPELLETSLKVQFGVLIGITGDVVGKLVLSGDKSVFGSIGETMYGMALDGEILASFSGELGNMIAGGLSTNIVDKGINIDITSPTIMQGDATLSGYQTALHVPVEFENVGQKDIYLLLD